MVNMVIVFHCSTSITAITGRSSIFLAAQHMDVSENGALGFGDCQFQGNHYHPVDLHGGFVVPQYYVPLYPHFQISCHTIYTCSILY